MLGPQDPPHLGCLGSNAGGTGRFPPLPTQALRSKHTAPMAVPTASMATPPASKAWVIQQGALCVLGTPNAYALGSPGCLGGPTQGPPFRLSSGY